MTESNFELISQAIKSKQIVEALRLIEIKKRREEAGLDQGPEDTREVLVDAGLYLPEVSEHLLTLSKVKASAADQNNQALLSACRKGHFKIIKQLLSIKNVQELAATQDNRALIYASSNGHTKCVKLLLTLSNVREAAGQNNQELYRACNNEHIEIIKLLLTLLNVRKTAANQDNEVLEIACMYGYTEIVKLLLNLPNVIEAASIGLGIEPLVRACHNGHIEIVKLLLSHRIIRDAAGNLGCKALISTCYDDHIEIAKLLLELPNVREAATAQNSKALITACLLKRTEIIRLFLSLENVRQAAAAQDNKAFIRACDDGETEVAKLLLALPSVREAATAQNNRAFIIACKRGMISVAQDLLTITEVRDFAAANNDFVLRLVCKYELHDLIETILNLPNLNLDLEALEQVWSREELIVLSLQLALILLDDPVQSWAERLSPTQQEALQLELCQTYNGLCQQFKSLKLPLNFPEDLEDEILSHLHPIAKQTEGRDSAKLLKSLTRAVIENQSLSVSQELSLTRNWDLLSRLLKQVTLQSEIHRCLRQALEQEDRDKSAAYLATPLLTLPLDWVSLAGPLSSFVMQATDEGLNAKVETNIKPTAPDLKVLAVSNIGFKLAYTEVLKTRPNFC